MALSKKYYKLIAGVIATESDARWYSLDLLSRLITKLADKFQKDNPRFDRIKFIEACWADKEDKLR